MEVGSHSYSHVDLTKLSAEQIKQELIQSKHTLEDLLGERIKAFCYPRGRFNRLTCALVKRAGYELGRTTVSFRTDLFFDPYAMPVAFQFFPHDRETLVRHAIGEVNFVGLWRWARRFGAEVRLERLTEAVFASVCAQGGILHIWGHSWELEDWALWSALRDVLRLIAARPGVLYLTNSEVLSVVRGWGRSGRRPEGSGVDAGSVRPR
jgi:hypothetical protein